MECAWRCGYSICYLCGVPEGLRQKAPMTWTYLVCDAFGARRGFARTVFLSISLIAGIADRALALDLTQSAYIGKNFTVEDGLLSNDVNVILQTRDGFLWIGTAEGLLRFDGRHFTPIKFLPQDSPILVKALRKRRMALFGSAPQAAWQEFRVAVPVNWATLSPPFTILVPVMAIRSNAFTLAETAISGWVHSPGSTASSTAGFQRSFRSCGLPASRKAPTVTFW